MKTKEQILFEIVDSIGEELEGDIHIIDTTPEYPDYEGEKEYRVYHSKGLCIDVWKKAESVNETTDEVETWDYDNYKEWDGFDNLLIDDIIQLLKAHTNG